MRFKGTKYTCRPDAGQQRCVEAYSTACGLGVALHSLVHEPGTDSARALLEVHGQLLMAGHTVVSSAHSVVNVTSFLLHQQHQIKQKHTHTSCPPQTNNSKHIRINLVMPASSAVTSSSTTSLAQGPGCRCQLANHTEPHPINHT